MANNTIKRKIEIEISQVNEKNVSGLTKHLSEIAKSSKVATEQVEALNEAFGSEKKLSVRESNVLKQLVKENRERENQIKLLKQYDALISQVKKSGNVKGKAELVTALESKRKETFEGLGAIDKFKYTTGGMKMPKFLTSELGEIKKALYSLWSGVKDTLIPSFSKLAQQAVAYFVDMLRLQNGIATYNAATSLFTNKSSRENQIKYGLTTAENYGMQTAMNMLNIKDDEDLAYMNTAQRNEFLKIMQKQAAFYDKMDKSGVLQQIQRLQMDFEEMKVEFANELLVFMANNKELIIGALKGILYITKAIMTVISWIGNIFKTSPSAYTSDSINNNTSNKTVNISVKATNNNNATLSGTSANFNTMSESFWNDLGRQIAERTE